VLAAEVRAAALLEVRIDDAKDAFDLVAVAVETRRQVLLRVVLHIAHLVSMLDGRQLDHGGTVSHEGEPSTLPVHGALSRHLEVGPRLLLPLRRAAGVKQAALVRLVVGLEEILDDGSAFPHFHSGVGVFDSGYTTVGVDGLERLLLEVGELHELGLVREVELVEEDGDLPRVGALSMERVRYGGWKRVQGDWVLTPAWE